MREDSRDYTNVSMNKSEPGPSFSPSIEQTDIAGVVVMSVPSVEYEYGRLTEFMSPDGDSIYAEPIDHMYFITNRRNSRREWHVHQHTFDRYLLVSGQIEIALHDARLDSASMGRTIRVELTPIGIKGAHGLRIPPGVWHSFRTNSQEFTLLNCKTPPYDRENPDKSTLSFEESGVDFEW